MELNTEAINANIEALKENMEYFDDVATKVATEQIAPLDDLMSGIYTNIISVDYPSTDVIEKYFLELSNCIYFMEDKVERLGALDCLSKIAFKEAYNENYMNPVLEKAKPTVAELTAYAEGETISEQVTNEIYSRAYKIVKLKLECAQTMVSTLSKTLSRRMAEQQLTSSIPSNYANGRQILNEEM